MTDDLVSRQAAIDALWKALYEYEDKTEKQFLESDDLDVGDWIQHRIFIQNMNDIDRQTILNLPPAQPERKRGKWCDVGSLSCRCSECGCKSQNESSFCPDCGAEMGGEQDEAD